MNVSCPSCPAKYVVPDAKIRGRRLRMVCRHCGKAFVVDGTGAVDARQDPMTAPVWIVMVNDRDATQMSARQLAELFAIGAIHSQTLVWPAGTTDYRTPFEFPDLSAALTARGFAPGTKSAHPPPLEDYGASDEATVVAHPALQAHYGAQGLPDADYDDERTVAVPRGTALAHFLDDGWSGMAPDIYDDEQTVAGDLRSIAAHAAAYDDDDSELGVARLPSELGEPEPQSSILIAPNSGEELTADPDAPAAPWVDAAPDRGRSTPSPLGTGSVGPGATYPRAPLPAAGSPASTPRVASSPWNGPSPPSPRGDAPTHPSHVPPVASSRPGDSRAGSAPRLLARSDSRIPPPPAAIPPPPVSSGPPTPSSDRLSAPSSPRDGARAAPVATARTGVAVASPPHPPRAEPRPPPAPADDFEAELAALRPRRHLLRTTGRVGAVLLLVATAATAGIYAYDRTLLSDEFPGLSEWLPSLFPPPAPPTGAVPSVAAPVPSAKAAPTASVASPDESASAAPPTELFDRRAAVAALTIAAESARSCYDPSSRIYGGMVIATFAPDGKVTKIDLRGPLADTSVGACVAKIFERAHIPPFLGEPVPVAHQVPLR